MSILPYVPHDELTGSSPDGELAADIAELSAFFLNDSSFLLSSLRNDIEIGIDEYADIDEEIQSRDAVIDAASRAIDERVKRLGEAYPFTFSDDGIELTFRSPDEWGATAYLLCLVLSHLSATPVLDAEGLLPPQSEINDMRKWFQDIAAPALAQEIRGTAWAFGWPRRDQSDFLTKLKAIWLVVGDGRVRSTSPGGSPPRVKDDEVDLIAARPHADGLPGFLLALGQVATGKNWREKSIRNAAQNVFFPEWFEEIPAAQPIAYHVVPYLLTGAEMRRETRRLGTIIHRLRLCLLLQAAEIEHEGQNLVSEGTDSFPDILEWIIRYRSERLCESASI